MRALAFQYWAVRSGNNTVCSMKGYFGRRSMANDEYVRIKRLLVTEWKRRRLR
jgi:hypothetical protein